MILTEALAWNHMASNLDHQQPSQTGVHVQNKLIESFTAEERAGLTTIICALSERFPDHDTWYGVLAGGTQTIIFGSLANRNKPAFAIYQRKGSSGPTFGLRFDDRNLRAHVADELGEEAYSLRLLLEDIAADSSLLQFHLSRWSKIDQIVQRMEGQGLNEMEPALETAPPGDSETEWLHDAFVLAKQRRGQATFRRNLIHAFQGRCAISDCPVESVLEACHIDPHCKAINYSPANGLLLRSDLHRLFDAGMLTIDGECRVHVRSPADLDPAYAQLHGTLIRAPALDQQSLARFREALASRFIAS